MRRLVGVSLLALAAGGCTSVKMVQRDGCWVRRTEKPFGRVLEEVGPCKAPEPRWAQDRLTRLVQECVAAAEFRAQTRALEDFSRRFLYPTPQPQKEETLRICMEEVRSGMEAERDREGMEKRLAELTGERDALKEDAARDRAKLFAEVAGERDTSRQDAERDRARFETREDKLAEWLGRSHDKLSEWLGQSQGKLADGLGQSQGKLAEWLGQAAQKPPGNATASATSSSNSDGKATTTNDTGATVAADSGASAPPAPAPVSNASVIVPAVPATVAAPPASGSAPPVGASTTPAGATPKTAQAPADVPRRTRTLRARRTASSIRPVAVDQCQHGPGEGTPATASTPPCAAAGATPSGP